MRFKNKTRGGYDYRIYAEYENQTIDRYHGAIEVDGAWSIANWDHKGVFNYFRPNDYFDLILNPPPPIDEICVLRPGEEYFEVKSTRETIGYGRYQDFAGHTVRLRIEVVE